MCARRCSGKDAGEEEAAAQSDSCSSSSNDSDADEGEGEGKGGDGCKGNEANEGHQNQHQEDTREGPCVPPVGKKMRKALDQFECPHSWRILELDKLQLDSNNVRMMPHAALDVEWAKRYPGWGLPGPGIGD